MAHPPRPRNRSDFEIAIICALRLEADAVEALFSQFWGEDSGGYGKAQGDTNAYTTGVIGNHNVVLTVMPGMGKGIAASVASNLRFSFGGIKLALVVGICGGLPNDVNDGNEILLGDVVISDGLIQYDFGRQFSDGFVRKDSVSESLGRQTPEIRMHLMMLKSPRSRMILKEDTSQYLTMICEKLGVEKATYPGAIQDKLFQPDYRHKHHNGTACAICAKCEKEGNEVCEAALDSLCPELNCDDDNLVSRSRLSEGLKPTIHFGFIASGDSVIKSAEHRDRIAAKEKVIAFEMEGAGVWDNLPCIVIKGVCDYADSHKNKIWQGYAAASAAACMKALLKEWIPTEKPLQVEQPGPWFIVPYTSNQEFVGRTEILHKLQKDLVPRSPREKWTYQSRIALFGLGGIGKTQVALAHAYRVQEKFPEASVFWVHASNRERFYQAFSHIAHSCQIPGYDDPKVDICKLLKDWLERKDQRQWLMIIDNADDTETFFDSDESKGQELRSADDTVLIGGLAQYIPECSHGLILVTTRNKETGLRLTKGRGMVEVKQMDPAESIQLIYKRLEADSLDPGELALLASRLENIPLALVQAVAFIQERCSTITKYLELLDKSDSTVVKLLSRPFQEVGRDSSVPNTVTATWMVSFEQIRLQYPSASDLLSLMSFFDRQGIPRAFLEHYSDQKYGKEDEQPENDDREDENSKSDDQSDDQSKHDDQGDARSLCDQDEGQSEPDAVSSLELENALGVLKAFSFVSEGKEEGFNMHRLVQLVTRKWLIKDGKSKEWASSALSTVSYLYPFGKYENRAICEDYLPHAVLVLSHTKSSSTEDAVAEASLQHCVAGLMQSQGKWMNAEELLMPVVKARKKVLGPEHPDTLASMANLALVHSEQGRWEEAEELAMQVVEISKRVLGTEHRHTLTIMGSLATIYNDQGRWKEAEELNLQVIETQKRALGTEHPDTLTSMGNLAVTWREQGRCEEGEELELQVMEITKRVLGTEHRHTLTSMGNLALTYTEQGRWEEGEELALQVVETAKRVLGTEHRDTLISMGNLALIYDQSGQWKEAEELNLQVFETRKRVLGTEHRDTLTSMNNLAVTWREQGKHSKAVALIDECLILREKILGIDHPHTKLSRGWLHAWQMEDFEGMEDLKLQDSETSVA